MSTPLRIALSSVEIANAHETIRPSSFSGLKPGSFVAVKLATPTDEKTYLGMYLCSAPVGVTGKQVGDKVVLSLSDYTNPAIYVPELNRIVWGYESWWGRIEDENHLRQITDEDISNTWYVRALKQLTEKQQEQA